MTNQNLADQSALCLLSTQGGSFQPNTERKAAQFKTKNQQLFNKISTIILVRIILILLFSLLTSNSWGQNESGTRRLNKAALELWGNWYDTVFTMQQHKLPIIRSIPPVSYNMPINVLIGYTYLDSILRFKSRKQIDSAIKATTSLNDTIKWAVSALYEMTDYDPRILKQYNNENQFNFLSKKDTNRLKSRFGDKNGNTLPIIPDTVPKIGKYIALTQDFLNIYDLYPTKYPDIQDREAIKALLTSDHILKIKVLMVDSTYDRHYGNDTSNRNKLYIVTASVLDTIKGQKFNSSPCNNELKLNNNISNCNLIKFYYSSEFGDQYGGVDHDLLPSDTLLKKNDIFSLENNKDYVVCLEYANALVDFQNDYFDVYLNVNGTYSIALQIVNGLVHDQNSYWGPEWQPYQLWRNKA